jgi:hypothetical protein
VELEAGGTRFRVPSSIRFRLAMFCREGKDGRAGFRQCGGACDAAILGTRERDDLLR